MRRTLKGDELEAWVRRRVPESWFTDLDVSADHEEILIVGTLEEPERGEGEGDSLHAAACETTIVTFRETTRDARIAIAREAERTLGRTLSWGADCGPVRALFTSNTVPVMTRLRLPERRVLDTLVDAGVARSRSHALAWCVRRVGEREAEWLEELRGAFAHVEAVRHAGPDLA